MLVYDVIDHTGAKSRHLCVNKISAIQAHLIHYGLSYLQEPPKVSDGIPLIELYRSSICWDLFCCMAGATDYGDLKPSFGQKKF